jgi:hemerythrin-like metal-binding protein
MEVVSHGGDIGRHLRTIKVPEKARSAAEAAPVQLCRFTTDFDVRVEKMNDDHRRIFDYINALHLRIKEKADPRTLVPTFKDFAEFTRAHFAREEDAMARAGYQDLPAQQRAHTKLLAQVADIIKAMEAPHADVDFIEVLGVFRDWLINHIMGMDKKYGPTLHAAGIT